MELKFLGRGAAFNPKEGSNSAYFIEKEQLFLIDCGESVFQKIIEKNILNKIEKINLLITHTHSDHIGSIGSLVMYSYHNLKKSVNIIIKKEAKYLQNIKMILTGFGCSEDAYKFVNEEEFDNKFNSFQTIRFLETVHCKELDCYGILFTTNNGLIYYSGDSCETNTIDSLITSGKNIDKIYLDSTTVNSPGNVHLYLGKINEHIPEKLKNKVYCMHINNNNCIKEAKSYGFNVVQI